VSRIKPVGEIRTDVHFVTSRWGDELAMQAVRTRGQPPTTTPRRATSILANSLSDARSQPTTSHAGLARMG
jgi:hypothetical protein